ncbi:helix-turn-helix domain-containing protein [Kitasatospora sp. NPDC096147]|uniref:helix-turn-helix domain-containing protein n=1 Tax=Kitasatospora sp. NPDC096147 TaxID=3364093 RepID=UPI0037F4ACE2
MEALAVRLSGLDPYLDGAIRIIGFYDTLMRRRVDLPALARTSAGLAECVTGIRLHGTGRAVRYSPQGVEAPGPAGAVSARAVVTLDEEEIGEVWLERSGRSGPLDGVLLERLAIAVAAVAERYGPARTTMADPALVELVIGSDSEEAARARALRLLGFRPERPLWVVAVRAAGVPLDRIGALICPGQPVKAAVVGGVGVLLSAAVDRAAFPPGVRAGLSDDAGPGGDGSGGPARSWQRARIALRFSSPREPVVHHGELGALALLAAIPPELARADPDVLAVARIAAVPEDLDTLDAYARTGSLRRAAELLHRHHSSVARRIDQLGRALGLDLADPAALARARLALTVWRLLDGSAGG